MHEADIDAFLATKLTGPTLAGIKESIVRLASDELREAIIQDMELETVEDLAPLLGPVEWLGGSDSSRFAVMVAGRIDVWAV